MNIFLVGGAVRDGLLGLPVAERDWVVVGADAQMMRDQGFVAADRVFPVFLHPDTGEEYALARREQKTGRGYRGFDVYCGPDVTLEEDLRRRDLTINAMARDRDGRLIDPFGGRDDLDAALLRHVSPAFIEDPLRVVRTARFAGKLGGFGFRVAHSTHRLMCAMVQDGEIAHLKHERFWREMSRAMATVQPWRFFEVLHRCGALSALIPALAGVMGEAQAHQAAVDAPPVAALKRISAATPDPVQRLCATLLGCIDSAQAADELVGGLHGDRETARLLHHAAAGRTACERAMTGDVEGLYEFVSLARGFERAGSLSALVNVCSAQRDGSDLARYVEIGVAAARKVSASDLRARGLSGPALGEALRSARLAAMREALQGAGL